MSAKQWLKSHLPSAFVGKYRKLRLAMEERRNRDRSPEEVFSEIYRRGKWGISDQRFCSGSGTIEESVVAPYVAAIGAELRAMGSPVVVDLGCGDFTVGQRLLTSCKGYVGVDVVPALIEHLEATVNDPKASFRCLDIVEDALPDGDVCLIRQVFQHLANAQISRVIAKLNRYAAVFVTEHQPVATSTPNVDKVQGSAIRLYWGSGVYLDRAPFDCSTSLLLEVPAAVAGYAGMIRTFRIKT